MPMKTVIVEPELFLTHNGVNVFRTYVEDDAEYPDSFIFTTNSTHTDSSHVDAFDVRTLPIPSVTLLETAQPPKYQGAGSALKPTKDYQQAVIAWEKWFKKDQPALIKRLIIEALDMGHIT